MLYQLVYVSANRKREYRRERLPAPEAATYFVKPPLFFRQARPYESEAVDDQIFIAAQVRGGSPALPTFRSATDIP